MHTNEPKEDPLVELGYDHRDVDYKRLVKAVIAFLSFGVGSALVGAIIYTNRFAIFRLEEPRPGIDAQLGRRAFAKGTPFIQDNVASKVDIMTLRQMETKRMTSTGYTDDSHQYAHIPVDRAMEIVSKKGVSGTAAGQPDYSHPIDDVGDTPRFQNGGDAKVPVTPSSTIPPNGGPQEGSAPLSARGGVQ